MLHYAILQPKQLEQNATMFCKMLRSIAGHKKCHSVFPEENKKKVFFGLARKVHYYMDKKEGNHVGNTDSRFCVLYGISGSGNQCGKLVRH